MRSFFNIFLLILVLFFSNMSWSQTSLLLGDHYIHNNLSDWGDPDNDLYLDEESPTILSNFNSKDSQNYLDKISIYPNPVLNHNYVTIELGSNFTDLTIDMISAEGFLIESQFYENIDEVKFSTQNLIEGVYFISIHYNGKNQVLKLLK